MDEFAQWYADQLAVDERLAQRVGGAWRQIGETGVIVSSDGTHAEECANGNWTGIAEHIVEHDPQRVLREVEAQRALLAQFSAAGDRMDRAARDDDLVVYQESRAEVRTLHYAARLHAAAAYCGRPGYREEWRPRPV
ncbi:DUF6221 family protein [Streptomyces aquilus]|uniref:DUF6221 family protein n=1 Tax=Streptomyces aquilus TaxID=2548456 RepID=UPI0037CF3617